ncbi:hypothetical protein [Streptomyces graminilatus]|uniref:hypothetical protein n=1 Tax=Streptomyces graminilatus TaxID=1464070 RepID=UPI0006E332DF|nr:hypothetical protein [Streptomyces graminilatus]
MNRQARAICPLPDQPSLFLLSTTHGGDRAAPAAMVATDSSSAARASEADRTGASSVAVWWRAHAIRTWTHAAYSSS